MRALTWLVVVTAFAAACGEVKSSNPDAAAIDAATDAPIDADIDAPPATHTVTIAIAGNGTGMVTSAPAGINCPGSCTLSVVEGTMVTLTATPSGASLFAGWSGACNGTGPCTITVNADVTVNASFALNHTLVVTKTGNGNGAVTSNPVGINCGADCDETYAANTMVTLTATPGLDSDFTGWTGGGCTGTGTCTVTITSATTVAASFTIKRWTLSVALAGTGGGIVSSNPSGISCGADCSEQYNHGTLVTLTQVPNASSMFGGWSGACTGTGSCIVTMDQMRNVTAIFTQSNFGLTVTRAGNGTGTVTSNPAGINCGADCTETYAANTMVTLTATPATGSTFTGWSGGGCTGTGTCIVTINAAISVTATFTLTMHTLTVTRAGTGSGTVTGTGINCGADCSEVVNYGTVVALSASAGPGSTFAGWSGGGCTGTGACNVTVTAATTVTATFNGSLTQPNLMFITSTTHTGNLGGLTGADSICQARANAAGRAGTYRAWLATASTSAVSRLGMASGWTRVDGLPVANTQADLMNGRLMYLPTLDETGVDRGSQTVWTGTTETGSGGTPMGGTYCGNWTVADSTTAHTGTSRTSSAGWTYNYSAQSCGGSFRLYCFGVDRTTTATAPSGNFRRVFTSQTISGNVGLAGFDARCASEASAAGLTGTYRALVATNTASAASRFNTSGAPWARVDNVLMAPTAAAFFTTATWNVAPNLSANGQSTFQFWGMWSGAANMSAVGTDATTCNNWTLTSGVSHSGLSDNPVVASAFGSFPNSGCTAGYRLVCMQQ